MPHGGRRAGAGRPTKDETWLAEQPVSLADAPECAAKTPLEYMQMVMCNPKVDKRRRDYMAVAAAPYLHAKAGESGKKDARVDAAKRAGAGRFATAEPPKLQ